MQGGKDTNGAMVGGHLNTEKHQTADAKSVQADSVRHEMDLAVGITSVNPKIGEPNQKPDGQGGKQPPGNPAGEDSRLGASPARGSLPQGPSDPSQAASTPPPPKSPIPSISAEEAEQYLSRLKTYIEGLGMTLTRHAISLCSHRNVGFEGGTLGRSVLCYALVFYCLTFFVWNQNNFNNLPGVSEQQSCESLLEQTAVLWWQYRKPSGFKTCHGCAVLC
jgi:hypothetical protein